MISRCDVRVLAAAVFCLALLGLTGCGGGSAVQGTVTYKGEPLESGGISFVSSEAQTGEATTAGEDIRDGKYSISADRGLKPGKYKVEIYGNLKSETPASGDPDMQTSSGSGNAIPAKYNTQTELTADITSGSNTIDFDLQP